MEFGKRELLNERVLPAIRSIRRAKISFTHAVEITLQGFAYFLRNDGLSLVVRELQKTIVSKNTWASAASAHLDFVRNTMLVSHFVLRSSPQLMVNVKTREQKKSLQALKQNYVDTVALNLSSVCQNLPSV